MSAELLAMAQEWRERAEDIWARKGKDFPAQSRAVEAAFKQCAGELESLVSGPKVEHGLVITKEGA